MNEEKRRQLTKLFIVPIIILALLSILIFLEGRGTSHGSATVEFTASVLDKDNSSRDGQSNLVAGKEALLTFKLIDNMTGQPISGLSAQASFYSPGEHDPAREHQHLNGYHFTKDVSLIKLQLFVLNSERGTIEVLDTFGNYDPRPSEIKKLGTMTSKVIRLGGSSNQKVADMVASRYGSYVYASIPAENQIAVVNTISREVVKYIDVGAAPGIMFLQPGSKYLWVSNDGDGTVSVIDTDNNVLARTIKTEKGYHQIAFSPENAYVTNSDSGKVAVIRLNDLVKQKDIEVERSSYGIDYSKVSNQVYVSNILQGTVNVIDAKTNKIKKNIPLDRGIEVIKFSPDGRLGVGLNPHANTAYIIDTGDDSLVKTVKTGEAPNAVSFMEGYALVRNSYSPDITYISMSDPGISNIAEVGIEPSLTWMPHSIITTSYGDEAVVTSPREGKIYFMHTMNGEPMAMGSASVEYGSDGLAVVENKLHETSPGVYQQYIILDREGYYDIEFKTQKINATFKIEVLPDLTAGFQTLLLNKTFIPGRPETLQYHITEKKTGQPVDDLTDLTYIVVNPVTSKGTWTKSLPSRYIGNGTYEARIAFPEEGEYVITISSSTLNGRGYETAYDYITVRNHT